MKKWINALAVLTAFIGCTSAEERALRTYLNQAEHATTERLRVRAILVELNESTPDSPEAAESPQTLITERLVPAARRSLEAAEAISQSTSPRVLEIHTALLSAERRRLNGVLALAGLTRAKDTPQTLKANLSFLIERWMDALSHQERHRNELIAACEEHDVLCPEWTASPASLP